EGHLGQRAARSARRAGARDRPGEAAARLTRSVGVAVRALLRAARARREIRVPPAHVADPPEERRAAARLHIGPVGAIGERAALRERDRFLPDRARAVRVLLMEAREPEVIARLARARARSVRFEPFLQALLERRRIARAPGAQLELERSRVLD